MSNLFDFFRVNYIWLVPISVAVISGILAGLFSLLKKQQADSKSINMNAKAGENSVINQINLQKD